MSYRTPEAVELFTQMISGLASETEAALHLSNSDILRYQVATRRADAAYLRVAQLLEAEEKGKQNGITQV